ncbi:PAS domain-containing protein [Paraurantiacibacter namhicola]|nr:PAS domain-containing protein [Paraurantiacibacter namhicola]
MLDQSTDCVKLVNLDGYLEYMNANGRAAMEIDDFSGVAGTALTSLWPASSAKRLSLAIERASKGDKDRFEAFCPTAKGNDRWWDVSVSPVRNDGEVSRILISSRDVTDRHLAERDSETRREADISARQDRIVAGELAHKARNQIAVITALTRLTLRGDPALEDGAKRLIERITHLGLAINALVGTEGKSARLLEDIVSAVLGDGDGSGPVMIGAIPPLSLTENDVRTMALVLGELHSNALKHGALSHEGGSLVLYFDPVPGGVRMRWKETGMADCREPSQLGTGSDLIRRMTMGQPKAGTFEWEPDGLYFEMIINASSPPPRAG